MVFAPDKLEFRSATEADAERILHLLTEAAHWLMAKGIDQWRPSYFSLAGIRSEMSNGNEYFLVYRDEACVGTFYMAWSDPSVWKERDNADSGYLHRFTVSREHAGLGIGEAMLRWASDYIARRGRGTFRLDCIADNPRLNRMYRDAGFQYVDTVHFQNGWRANLYEMPAVRRQMDEAYTADAVADSSGGALPFRDFIRAEDDLRQLLGEPNPVVARKTIRHIDRHCADFMARSPLVFVSTANGRGECDVSPRGDAPGFALVLDDWHLVLPERPGNRRMDAYRNLLVNPRIGLVFVIPGMDEVLRVNGEAWIVRDVELMERMSAFGKVPKLGIGVRVAECYFHCGKAFKRSHVWEPERWPDLTGLTPIARMIADHVGSADIDEAQVAQGLKESYELRMY
ncbi:MSMEG_1061 family FMN-dependent PPOX-type flavoprotein [Paenibacillus aurantiacus]|uniref:MSMEG_1061 family FMN-dependent PPOX-type flavoprotein n=1 Tax=Paenibacillus aurantiacus TaxID=1936118 RepID=A0ABV5KPN8_9BACL